ncbi:hypothetical protein EZI54_20695 [Marinobacter halodurans]|uniref:Uncharacterized protein n=1 Tax=Marinobacter halodurans TaxID=2528979 RepID=A0ABY1ZF51_9GAMM|nr:hypothetical protein [Marinobacter halodurans]TBW48870.1 hypothetical protein EZI54_20695 [Marinobacter halodurans]
MLANSKANVGDGADMAFGSYIDELQGYLKALQRIAGPAFAFGVRYEKTPKDLNAFIAEKVGDKESILYGEKIDEKREIKYRDLMSKINHMIFDGQSPLKESKDSTAISYLERSFSEDINEYYGLESSLLTEGAFHPLVEGPVHFLKIEKDSEAKSFCFLVRIGEYWILTYFFKSVVA